MAQMTSVAAGRVNRRFLFLALILAGLSAVLAYVALSSSGGESTGGGDVSVLVAKSEIGLGEEITLDMVEVKQIDAGNLASGALSTTDAAVGEIARARIAENEQILSSNLLSSDFTSNDALSYIIENGSRGISMMVDEVIAVGGLILPGDHVDVLWVPFAGAQAFTLLSDVEVTAVSQSIVDVAPTEDTAGGDDEDGNRARVSDGASNPLAVSVTLMVKSVGASETLLCAEWHAMKFDGQMRLVLRRFGDTTPVETNAPPCPPRQLLADQEAEAAAE